ncbi:MAG: hypothetical protein KDA81_21230, partial [Planctomycetaceae bacterium]|nr:hypothetical protein [Planctomycetaceae bacterium]
MTNLWGKRLHWLSPLVLLMVTCGGVEVFAQEAAEAAEAAAEVAAPEYYEKAEIDYTINTLIMFICAILVLFMQAGF